MPLVTRTRSRTGVSGAKAGLQHDLDLGFTKCARQRRPGLGPSGGREMDPDSGLAARELHRPLRILPGQKTV